MGISNDPQISGMSPQEIAIRQARFGFNEAAERLQKNPNDPAAVRDFERATTEYFNVAIRHGLIDAKQGVGKRFAELNTKLQEDLRNYEAELAKNAAGEELVLQKQRLAQAMQLYTHEAQSLFDQARGGQQMTITLVGMFKGFAVLGRLFGADTDDFIAQCDEELKLAQRDLHLDTRRLTSADTNLSTDQSFDTVNHGMGVALGNMGVTASQINKMIDEINGSVSISNTGQSGASQTGGNNSLQTSDVKAAIRDITDPAVSIEDKAHLFKKLDEIALKDGNAAEVTKDELMKLRMGMSSAADGALKTKLEERHLTFS